MRRPIVIATVALLVGLVVGYFVGRWYLEYQWSHPVQLHHASASPSASTGDATADPAPADGTRVLRPMPLARTRRALPGFTAGDPVVIPVGAVSRETDADRSLHIVLRNRGRCRVVSVAGVAYGFDAYGQPVAMNRGGEHYVAFATDEIGIDPGATTQASFTLRRPETASLVVGHVDRVACADGTRWARR
jgi:hypothetical protein